MVGWGSRRYMIQLYYVVIRSTVQYTVDSSDLCAAVATSVLRRTRLSSLTRRDGSQSTLSTESLSHVDVHTVRRRPCTVAAELYERVGQYKRAIEFAQAELVR